MWRLSNVWRIGVLVVFLLAFALFVRRITGDEDSTVAVSGLAGLALAGALWPVELGLKAAPEDEPGPDPGPDAAPERT